MILTGLIRTILISFCLYHSDIMAVAKGIGGGFPMGAFMANAEASKGITPGSHGSTYGGGPLAMAVGQAVLDELTSDGFLDHVNAMSVEMFAALNKVQTQHPDLIELVRGSGLMIGIKIREPFTNMQLFTELRNQNALTVPAGDNTVRVLPPLNINASHIDEFAKAVAASCVALKGQS